MNTLQKVTSPAREQASRATILLVDNDADYLERVSQRLSDSHFKVIAYETPSAARAWLSEHRPDAAIIDLINEEPDGGFALCHHIKQLDPEIPVIIVSAVTSETGLEFDATTAEERSWIKADALLAKPIRHEQLQRELRRLVADRTGAGG